MMCWPTGRPSVWAEWERLKVKMMVSAEMRRLEARGAVVQERGFRNVGEGSLGTLEGMEGSERRVWRAEGERVPRW